jgi:hypothetical protein
MRVWRVRYYLGLGGIETDPRLACVADVRMIVLLSPPIFEVSNGSTGIDLEFGKQEEDHALISRAFSTSRLTQFRLASELARVHWSSASKRTNATRMARGPGPGHARSTANFCGEELHLTPF